MYAVFGANNSGFQGRFNSDLILVFLPQICLNMFKHVLTK